uniref:Ribosomal protein L5 n=1 Tax=Glaucocystis nostochinearum TaxID=38271 RepID=E9P6C6_9EUKA|nr:ribosomal protein L5 [Glaucocystis nostochinearum]ADW83110.1 ribosomal protein L5 [Glaucocystis nostochinearum]
MNRFLKIKEYNDNVLKYDFSLRYFCPNNYYSLRIKKINIQILLSEILINENLFFFIISILKIISYQHSLPIFSKKAIANFSLKKHMIIGAIVCLRKLSLLCFISKFQNLLNQNLDLSKNYTYKEAENNLLNITIGLKNISVFPEIESQFSKISRKIGADIMFTFFINLRLKKNKFIYIKQHLNAIQLLI